MNPGPIQQATDLIDRGDLAAAEAHLTRLLSRQPADPNLNSLMGYVAALAGKREQALYYADRARRAAPDHSGLIANHASALSRLGRFAEVIGMLTKERERGALIADSYTTLTNALLQTRRFEDALSVAGEGAQKHPAATGVVGNFALALQQLGYADEALGHWRRASDLDPRSFTAAGGLVSCSLYAQTADPERARADLARVDAALRVVLGAPRDHWNVSPEPDRVLRIGLLSGDLRRHSMAFFIEPILRNYDRAAWHVACYHTGSSEDDVSERLKSLADTWRREHDSSEVSLADRIHKDKIDVLLDFAGHTAGCRPATLHLRPAPVQATLIGYPGSLGISSVGWRITDTPTDPADARWPGPEQLLRVDPCAFAYAPPPDAPGLVPPPCASSGSVTFGSFNSLQKWTDATIGLYAGVLRAAPRSRLLAHAPALQAQITRDRLRDRLARAGAAPEQLLIEGPLASARDTLAEYARVDIALDTFPYHGMTTTCEALWMGVPVVTLPGRTSAARVGCCHLQAVGAPDLIASSPEEYARIAAGLAADPRRLAAWRSPGPEGLRERVRTGPHCDGVGYCRKLESCVRQAWRAWCDRARQAHVPSE